MRHNAEEVMKILQEVAQDMKLDKKIQQIICREDYGDYQAVLDGTHHCEIREKLVEMYVANKDPDSLREIKGALQNAALYEEWERLDAKKREDSDDDDVLIDDTEI